MHQMVEQLSLTITSPPRNYHAMCHPPPCPSNRTPRLQTTPQRTSSPLPKKTSQNYTTTTIWFRSRGVTSRVYARYKDESLRGVINSPLCAKFLSEAAHCARGSIPRHGIVTPPPIDDSPAARETGQVEEREFFVALVKRGESFVPRYTEGVIERLYWLRVLRTRE